MDSLTADQKDTLKDMLQELEDYGWDYIAAAFNSRTGLSITANQVCTFYLGELLGF
jgi:hypothetical protein